MKVAELKEVFKTVVQNPYVWDLQKKAELRNAVEVHLQNIIGE